MLTTVLIILVVLIAALLIYAAMKPDNFTVSRSASIKAPPEAIFPLINDFKRWTVWSPYEKLDPDMKRTLSGADSGKGAAYAWEGNGKAGAGRMEITKSVPSSLVALKLDFEKPFKANNTVDFTLVPAGNNTAVTWAMHGRYPFIAKLMGIFINMDRMVGKDFETGLANLKSAAEK
ncbi:SRPBCC family protein [Mesorhizobium sp. YC-39]|uniref:SRPBCC family protein n=1 Tax=unclassified Mesorhizobium TaxID=325217 RepID=UPI0021E8B560|nr:MULTISPECIES: SRPBCC family protein [unclassified Mesorhizobium]MCV3211788.1 SRPBCC family protein [Mesorhizobium sp. YC-2]MCV3233460.1 SRPBCC family protein [Mesorhizobium sp. YC-39]